MSRKKVEKKRIKGFKDIKSLVPKNFIKSEPSKIIKKKKNKIENYYSNLKKEREKEKKRKIKQRELEEKKEIEKQKK